MIPARVRRTPGARITLDAAVIAGSMVVVTAALLWALSAVDRAGQGEVRPTEAARLLGPVCGAVGVALAVVAARHSGRWSAWSALGVSGARQLAPILVLTALAGVVQLVSPGVGGSSKPSDALASLRIPAPVALDARLWPGPDGTWTEPDLDRWRVPPASLGTADLVRRARVAPPVGARRGSDLAELLRRGGWALAWPLGGLLGARVGLHAATARQRSRGHGVGAALVAAGSVLVWLVAVLALSAYVSMIT